MKSTNSEKTMPFKNPYVGPRAFEANEFFFGRSREIRQLKSLLIAERLVLLHSPSGAGKTSLLQAGLLPEVHREEFYIFPTIRVGHTLPGIYINTNINQYLFSMLLSLEEQLSEEKRIPLEQLGRYSLDEYMDHRYRPDEAPKNELLVFDQFEEILTTKSYDQESKITFFTQLGEMLANPNMWALFAIREDYLGALAPYLRYLPNHLNCTYRLDLLDIESARQAIQKPAQLAGLDFADTAAQQLVNDLRRIQVQRSNGIIDTQLGVYVEPVQLQVVCYRLWEKRGENGKLIDIDDLVSVGNVDQSLAEYYQDSIKHTVEQTGVKERFIREWFENKLIHPGGVRGQVPMGTAESDGLNNDAIMSLIDAHIIRADKRIGITWFELAHDRLIEPIQWNNASWFAENLSMIQKQAVLWEMQGQPESLLLRGNELMQAIDWAAENEAEITPIETRFVADSQRAFQHEQEIQDLKSREQLLREEELKAREVRRKRLIIGLLIGLIIAIGLILIAFVQNIEMQKQKQRALDRLLLAKVQLIDVRESKMQIPRLGLAIEAYNRLQDTEAYRVIWSSTMQFGASNLHLQTNGLVKSMCFSADSSFLVSRSDNNLVQVWDITKGTNQIPITITIENPDSNDKIVGKVLCSPREGKFITNAGNTDGSKIIVWSTSTGTKLLEIYQDDYINDFAISPDGRYIITGSRDGQIVLWDADSGLQRAAVLDDNSVTSVAFSPKGNQVAFVNTLGDIVVWNLGENSTYRIKNGMPGIFIIYSPDSKWLVTGGKDGIINFWDSINGKKDGTLIHNEGITALSFSPDGNLLLSASEDGFYKIWEISKNPINELSEGLYYGPIHSASFSPDSKYFVIGGLSGYTQVIGFGKIDKMGNKKPLYSTATAFGEGQVYQTMFSPDGKYFASAIENDEIIIAPMTYSLHHDSKVWHVEFNKNSDLIATSSMDGTAKVWDLNTGQKVLELLHNNQINYVTFSPNSDLIATASSDHTAKVWRLSDGKEILSIPHNSDVVDIKFNHDGSMVGSAAWDGLAQIWDLANHTMAFSIIHDNKINRILFSSDGKWVITASDDHTIQLWNINQRKKTHTFVNPSSVNDVDITSNGKYIISGDNDGDVITWDTQLGRQVFVEDMGASPIYNIAVSSDGKLYAAGNEAGKVCVWQVDSGVEILCFSTNGAIWDIDFSPSDFVFAASLDGYVHIWDLHSKSEYLRIENPGRVLTIDLSSDNKLLAMGTTSGMSWYVLWNKEEVIPLSCEILPRQLTGDEWREYLGNTVYSPYCLKHTFKTSTPSIQIP